MMTENQNVVLGLFAELYEKSKQNPEAPFVQIVGASFELDYDDPIIDLPARKAPRKYIAKELAWYLSQSLSIHPIVDSVSTWNNVCDSTGNINSNYGWCVFSEENGLQFYHALQSLIDNKDSRQAICVYNRPSIHEEWNADGMHDFICTLATHFLINDNKLEVVHTMRSNDCIFGFVSDFAWVSTLSNLMFNALKPIYPELERGKLHWVADSFHVYKSHYEKLEQILDAYEKETIHTI